MSNRRLVALTGTALGFLTTPAHAAQEMPQGIGMIADLKFVPNDLGDPLQGPQLGPVPDRLSAPQ
jgi:hypothetical protein